MILVILVLSGCGTLTAKSMNKLSIGMSKAEVIRIMGSPTTTKADGNTEVLEYKRMADMQEWWTSRSSQRTNYWIVFENGELIKYGKAGDWDTAQPETIKHIIEADIITNQE